MMEFLVLSLLLLSMFAPYVVFRLTEKSGNRKKKFKTALFSNIGAFFVVLIGATVFVFTGDVYASEEVVVATASNANGMAFLGAALATGLGSIGAGIATGQAASSALGALSENEGIMGKALIFVALAEGVAIYGLVIAFMILNYVA